MKINKPKIITYQEKIFEEIEIDEQYNNYKFTKNPKEYLEIRDNTIDSL